MTRSRLVWYCKQALPLRYETTYRERGQRYHCVWRMWLGRCLRVETTPLPED